jgi:hypothetical protein
MNNNIDMDAVIMESFENARQQQLANPTNITREFASAISQYCHTNYYKRRAECPICYRRAFVHNCCAKCTVALCECCLMEINKNMETNKCPQCRFKYSLQFFTTKTNDNNACLAAYYGAEYMSAHIAERSIFEFNDNNYTDNRMAGYRLPCEYNYSTNTLDIALDDDCGLIQLPMLEITICDQRRIAGALWLLFKMMAEVSDGDARMMAWNLVQGRIEDIWQEHVQHRTANGNRV